MVAGVESDGALGPLEGPGGLNPGKCCRDFASELLEVAVGAGGLSPAEDASGPVRHLVAFISLGRQVVVRGLDGIGLGVLLVVVVVVVVVPASPPAAAAAASAALLPLVRLASLAKPLEVVAVLGGVGVPVVVDTEGTIIFLLGYRGWSSSLTRLLGVRLCREDRGGLALLAGFPFLKRKNSRKQELALGILLIC